MARSRCEEVLTSAVDGIILWDTQASARVNINS